MIYYRRMRHRNITPPPIKYARALFGNPIQCGIEVYSFSLLYCPPTSLLHVYIHTAATKHWLSFTSRIHLAGSSWPPHGSDSNNSFYKTIDGYWGRIPGMSAVFDSMGSSPLSALLQPGTARIPIADAQTNRSVLFGHGMQISLQQLIAQAHGVAQTLPPAGFVINLCEDRHRFLVAFCAAAIRGQVTLLPSSRAPAVIDEVRQRYPDSYCISDIALDPVPPTCQLLPVQLPMQDGPIPMVDPDALAVIGFTSGSTGIPKANRKTWRSFVFSNRGNHNALAHLWSPQAAAQIIATIPPQHMYGIEMSVLLPLLSNAAIHAGRPFFPHDLALAIGSASQPPLLVTTPIHLRALIDAGIDYGPVAGIVTATAPLSVELAAKAEQRFGCEVRELFGSTETCVIAHRRTAQQTNWQLYDGVHMQPQPDGTQVTGPHLSEPVVLADIIELHGERSFSLHGRQSDLLEIAGKRASLGDLTQRLLAVPGVTDAAVFQLDDAGPAGVCRIAAVAVAPGLTQAQILAQLRHSVDPAFLPRRLKIVPSLPRNETGKLPRNLLLSLLDGKL